MVRYVARRYNRPEFKCGPYWSTGDFSMVELQSFMVIMKTQMVALLMVAVHIAI